MRRSIIFLVNMNRFHESVSVFYIGFRLRLRYWHSFHLNSFILNLEISVLPGQIYYNGIHYASMLHSLSIMRASYQNHNSIWDGSEWWFSLVCEIEVNQFNWIFSSIRHTSMHRKKDENPKYFSFLLKNGQKSGK